MVRDPMYSITIERNVLKDKTNAQVLSDYEIVALAAYCKKIEQYYNFPEDIEWATERGRIYIVQSRAVTTLEEKKTEALEGTPILEGYGASPGVATGIVKIIHGTSEIWKIQKGDILVTEMTSPDYVPAMEKSAAIVTNQGGTTCIGKGTKILTEEGFKNIEDVYNEVKTDNKKIKTISLNTRTLRIEWRDIVDAQKRVSDVLINNVFLNPASRADNTISITPDHKMLTIDGMNVIKKQLNDLHNDNENLIIANEIPLLEDRYSSLSSQLMYLSGAIFSDGALAYKNFKPIGTRFSQKPEENKEKFITNVVRAFESEFNAPFKGYCINKFSGTMEFSSNRKLPAETLNNIKERLTDIMLFGNEEEITNFLAGFSDGDGHLNKQKGWLELYVDSKQENLVQALVIACLRLSIPFRISHKKRNCIVLILSNCEQLDAILSKCSRIKTKRISRTEGYKLFSAKQLIGSIRKDIDWRGELWTYVKRNSMIDIDKLVNYVRDKKIKEELRKFSESDIRMMRFDVVNVKEREEVFNLTIDADDELNHNYIVFTSRYTPIVVGNCHAAIVSRELSIPCIVGTQKATEVLKEGMKITVDATHGKVYPGEIEIKEEKAEEAEMKTKVQVKVNLAFPETAEKAKHADGVGLLRLEHMLTKAGMHPIEYIRQGKGEELTQIIYEGVGKVAKAFYPKHVWVRSLDARTDEFRNMKGGENEPKEDNPMLGWHGIRRSLDEPEILKAELKALKKLREEGLDNVIWELPFIINVSELRKAKEIAKEMDAPDNFGIMVEVPACALTIEEFCKEGIAFASFGSNDLTQTTLGLDRNNERLISLFDEMHPSMQSLFKHVIEVCKKYKVESSICGELPSNRKDAVEFLVKAGIDSLSVNLDAIDKVRKWASETESS
jgi:pyruvate,water dikinase